MSTDTAAPALPAAPRPRVSLELAAREWGTARGIAGRAGGYLYAAGYAAYAALPWSVRGGSPDQRGRFALVDPNAANATRSTTGARAVQGWHSLGKILLRTGQITVTHTDKGHARYTAAPVPTPAAAPAPAPAAAPAWHVGDAVRVAEGHNSNDVTRTDVPARIVGCRGPVVVVERTDPGRYHGEGLWAFASDLSPLT